MGYEYPYMDKVLCVNKLLIQTSLNWFTMCEHVVCIMNKCMLSRVTNLESSLTQGSRS